MGPSGDAVVLMDRDGGFAPVEDVTYTFDVWAATSLRDVGVNLALLGTFRPSGPRTPPLLMPPRAPANLAEHGDRLGVFVGTDPNGSCRLLVTDSFGGDLGRIAGWTITIASTP